MRLSGLAPATAIALLSTLLVVAVGCSGASYPRAAALVAELAPRAASGLLGQASESTPPRLDVFCDVTDDCPANVGMVVFPGDENPERCTGTLVGRDLVLTAGHCVVGAGRRPGALPDDAYGWVAFPESGEFAGEWHRVSEIVAIQDGKGEVLARDHALVRLGRPSARPVSLMSGAAPAPGSIVRIAIVTPHAVYSTQHSLRTRLCRVATAEAAEAALGEAARRVGWLTGCPIEPGNSGAPVFDGQGQVRALVHAGSDPFFRIGVTSPLPSP